MREKYSQPLAHDAMAYVLAGGRGSRLLELTDRKNQQPLGVRSSIFRARLSSAVGLFRRMLLTPCFPDDFPCFGTRIAPNP